MNVDVIAERYELEKRIGSGGMAYVYLARDIRLGRQVAVKILHAERSADSTFVERFRREAQAAASLNHPNIVSIYDWGPTGETYFIAMEYVPGKSLKSVLAQGALPEIDTLKIGAGIASALEAAHQQGVVHRDVKPQNVLLAADGQVKVVDFGIARATGLTQLTSTNMVCGTPHYISPEQVTRGDIDGRSDIYSLGVVLFEMATGEEPFRGSSLVEVALKHLQEPAVSPRSLKPGLSVETDAIILKALAKNPNDRFQTARDMQNALLGARQAFRAAPVAYEVTSVGPLPETTSRSSAMAAPRLSPIDRRAPEGQSSAPERRWLLAIPVLLILVAAVAAYHLLSTESGHSANTSSSFKAHQKASTPVPSSITSTTNRTAAAQYRHPSSAPAPKAGLPVRAMVTATSTPAPTISTSTPAGSSNSTLLASSDSSGPDSAVHQFYWFVAHHRWSQAAALWGPDMSSYDRYQNLNARFGQTVGLAAQTQVQQQDNAAGTAIVAVTLTETRAGSDSPSVLVGSWYVVRRGSTWLLDRPSFRYAE